MCFKGDFQCKVGVKQVEMANGLVSFRGKSQKANKKQRFNNFFKHVL